MIGASSESSPKSSSIWRRFRSWRDGGAAEVKNVAKLFPGVGGGASLLRRGDEGGVAVAGGGIVTSVPVVSARRRLASSWRLRRFPHRFGMGCVAEREEEEREELRSAATGDGANDQLPRGEIRG